MPKYTPGSWARNPDFPEAINAGDKHVAMANKFQSPNSKMTVWGEEYEANATLIAAAPELLEALECLIHDVECEIEPHGRMIDAFSNAKNAIAKAKGETK